MTLKLFGIRVYISFMFTVFIAVILLTDKTGYIGYFFLSAAVHEAAHLFAMLFLKAKPEKIKLMPGGINIAVKSVTSDTEDVIILFFGPFINLIFCLITKGIFSAVNLLLFIYNIMPFGGLDGGRILIILLSRITSENTALKVQKTLSFLAATALFVAFVLLYLGGTVNFSLIIFSLYIISTVFSKKVLKEKTV